MVSLLSGRSSLAEIPSGSAHPRAPARWQFRRGVRTHLPAFLPAVRGAPGAASAGAHGAALFGTAAGMVANSIPSSSSKSRSGRARPGGNGRRRILRADPDCHSARGSDRADSAAERFLGKHFESGPAGAWLAERVWEPQFPAALAHAGVDYTLVDDMHFLPRAARAGALRRLRRRGSRQNRSGFSRAAETCATCCRSARGGCHRLSAPVRRRPSWRHGGDGRRLRKIRRLAGHLRALLPRRLGGALLPALEAASDWLVTTPPGEGSPRTPRLAAPTCPPLPTPK